jgi:hypothetical protein
VATPGHGLMVTTPHRPAKHFFPSRSSPAQNQSTQEFAHF